VHPDRDSTHIRLFSKARRVAVIPARYQSSRLPGKPLVEIAGRPMIEHVYRRAEASPAVDAVVVATDDVRVRDAVEAFGGLAVMTRADHPSGSDRVAEVAASLSCDLVINVQGDEPLLATEMIAEAVAPLEADPSIPMGTLCRRLDADAELDDPNVVKVVTDAAGFALYFSRAPIPHVRGAAFGRDPRQAFKHIGLYVYRRAFLLAFARLAPTPLERAESLEQLRALEHGFKIRVVETRHDSVGVDTNADLERARRRAAPSLPA
jgi:3-deoxy-manno-octulosonate cytidylyltransferase (CMP-KDO synthetase)